MSGLVPDFRNRLRGMAWLIAKTSKTLATRYLSYAFFSVLSRPLAHGPYRKIAAKKNRTNNSFGVLYSKLEVTSNIISSVNKFENGHPFKWPLTGMKGNVKKAFSGLEMLVDISIDSRENNDCLTRPSGRMFHMSK